MEKSNWKALHNTPLRSWSPVIHKNKQKLFKVAPKIMFHFLQCSISLSLLVMENFSIAVESF